MTNDLEALRKALRKIIFLSFASITLLLIAGILLVVDVQFRNLTAMLLGLSFGLQGAILIIAGVHFLPLRGEAQRKRGVEIILLFLMVVGSGTVFLRDLSSDRLFWTDWIILISALVLLFLFIKRLIEFFRAGRNVDP